MAIRIPLTQNVTAGGQLAPKRSLSEGTQGLVALGKAAQVVGNIGQDIFDKEQKIQRVENARLVAKHKAGLRNAMAELDLELMDDQNPETWEKRTQEKLAGYLSKAGIDQLPPEAREEFDDWNSEYTSGAVLGVQRDAKTKVIRRAGDELRANVMESEARGDFEAAADYTNSNPLLSDQEKRIEAVQRDERKKRYIEKQEVEEKAATMRELDAQAIRDPAAMKARLEAGELDGHFKDDMEKIEFEGNLANARRQTFSQRTYEASEKIISGEISDESQIDALGVDGQTKERLKLDLAQQKSSAWKAAQLTPEAILARSARIEGLLVGMDGADDFSAAQAELATEIAKLPKGEKQTYYKLRLERVESGIGKLIETRDDAAMDAMERNHAREMEPFKPRAQETTIALTVEKGFLTDKKKLWKLFGEAGAGEDKFDMGMGFRNDNGLINDLAEGNEGKSEKEQLLAFRTAFDQLTPEQQELGLERLGKEDPHGRAIVEAMIEGESGKFKVSIPLPESDEFSSGRDKATRSIAREKGELLQWLKLNPEAKDTEANVELTRITGETVAMSRRESRSENKPLPATSKGLQNGGFIEGKTSMALPPSLAPYQETFVKEGLKYGIDPRFLVAISKLETASGKSSAFVNKKNAMGVSNSKGPISFSSVEDSISRMARVLASKSGPYRNANTIQEIAAIYAPPGAGNDPKGTNGYWATGVSKFYAELGGDPRTAIR